MRRYMAAMAAMGLVVLGGMWANVWVGSVGLTPGEVLRALLAGPGQAYSQVILWQIRLPRALGAALGGGLLGMSGLMLQVFFRNPIVGPFVLGISAGATLMVGVVMLTSIGLGLGALSPYLGSIAAFAGACGAMAVVVGVASRVERAVVLLIVGLMISYLASAVTNLLVALAEAERIKGFTLWTMGSFAGQRWEELGVMAGVGLVAGGGAMGMAKGLNAYLLGENYARTLGINAGAFRLGVVVIACAMAAAVTAAAGPVAFVGLAAPHMARLWLRTADNRLLVPATALTGAGITEICDLLARNLLSPVETPLSVVTSLFGAPVVIWLVLARSRQV